MSKIVKNYSCDQFTTLGMLLKEERQKLGLSIEKASNILMVRKVHLLNLEEDKFENFPAGVYFKGFLRNYARLLGLDENKVFEYYECQVDLTKEKENKIEDKGEKKEEKKKKFDFIITPELIIKLIIVVIGIGILLYFIFVLRGVSRIPNLYIEKPVNNQTVDTENIEIIGTVDAESQVEINNEKVVLGEAGKFKTTVSLMQGVNEINIRVENKFGKELQKKIFVNFVGNDQNQDKGEFKSIILKTDSKPVWIKVETENEEYSETMAASSQKEIEIKKETKITVEKGNQIYFIRTDPNQSVRDSYLESSKLQIFSENEGKVERVFNP